MQRFCRIPHLWRGRAQSALATVVVAAWVVGAGVASAEDLSGTATAAELLEGGERSFRGGRFDEAGAQFAAFLQDFGSSSGAAPALEGVRGRVAVSWVRCQKWEAALEAIGTFEQWHGGAPLMDDLRYWRGVALVQLGRAEEALDAWAAFRKHGGSQVREADVAWWEGLAAMSAKRWAQAAARFDSVRSHGAEAQRGHAALLELHCLIEEGTLEKAADRFVAGSMRWEGTGSVAGWHGLGLKLGVQLQQAGQCEGALKVFRAVWPRGRIEARQVARLKALEEELSRPPEEGADLRIAMERNRLEGLRTRLKQELEDVRGQPGFDVALTLRLAEVLRDTGRWRELIVRLRGAGALPTQDARAGALLVEGLMALKRWDEAAEAAERSLPRAAPGPMRLALLGMKAGAEGAVGAYAKALETHRTIAAEDGSGRAGERAQFMVGYQLIMMEQFEEAIDALRAFRQAFPRSDWLEHARFWEGMALAYAKRPEAARVVLSGFLNEYPTSSLRGEVAFRHAQTWFRQEQFEKAAAELKRFVAGYPKHERADEARLLLGDCHLAVGALEEGIAVLNEIGTNAGAYYELGVFRAGNAMKRNGEVERMKAHYEHFVRGARGSARASEALHEVGRVLARQGKRGEAEALFWSTLKRWGNDPEAVGVESILASMPGWSGEGLEALKQRLAQEEAEAARCGRRSWQARCRWALGCVIRREGRDPGETRVREAVEGFEPWDVPSRILMDAGDACRRAGDLRAARAAYEGVVRWHPLAGEARACEVGLGLVAAAEGNGDEALSRFAGFEALKLDSPLLVEMLMAQATILAGRGDRAGARQAWEAILRSKFGRGAASVEALLALGRLEAREGRAERAIAYFQRVYVMYGKWRQAVASALWESGLAFEALGREDEAARSWQELTNAVDLAVYEEYGRAQRRLGEGEGRP